MWSYDKEIEKIRAINLPKNVEDAIVALLDNKLPESSVCSILNQYLTTGEITQSQAYSVMDILYLIDEECLEDRFIIDY